MDASYNPFGSLGSNNGGQQPAQPIVSGAGTPPNPAVTPASASPAVPQQPATAQPAAQQPVAAQAQPQFAQPQARPQPSAQPISSGTGDIVLSSNSGTGKKRTGLIIGIVAVAVLAVAAIILAVVANGGFGGGGVSMSASFNVFVSLLKNGTDENTGWSYDSIVGNGELIYPLATEENTSLSYSANQDIEEYFTKLFSAYSLLRGQLLKNGASEDVLSEYDAALGLLDKNVNYYKNLQDLIDAYNSGGYNEAEEYFTAHFSYNGDSIIYSLMSDAQSNFYDAALYEYILYANSGCYEGGTYNYECAVLYYGEDNSLRLREANGSVVETFSDMTSDNILGMLNAQILEATAELYNQGQSK